MSYLLGLSGLQPQYSANQLPYCLTAPSPCQLSRLSGKRLIYVPKVSAPLSHSDYRPISITPVLSRLMEKLVVRHFLYSTFSAPPSTLNFSDQFAFRPSGSTTAALIYIFHAVTQLLTNYQYVSVIALDFTKAFDTVRHSTLLEKMADLAMPDEVYNWLVSYFNGHRHCTRYSMSSSALSEISAGIIQGSGIGPASYVVNFSDVTAVKPGNLMCKYADDNYLIIPSINVDTRLDELANVENWSRRHNLTLNRSKSQEIILIDRRRKRSIHHPPLLPDINRVSSIKILGATVSDSLSVCGHVNNVVISCAQSVQAMRILRAHGMATSTMHVIFNAVVVAKLTYAASSWWGFTTAEDRQRLEAVTRRGIRSGLCAPDHNVSRRLSH